MLVGLIGRVQRRGNDLERAFDRDIQRAGTSPSHTLPQSSHLKYRRADVRVVTRTFSESAWQVGQGGLGIRARDRRSMTIGGTLP